MKRLPQKDLWDWYHRSRRKPLVLRGARQVGKSTLVNLFAKEEGLELATINLEVYRDLDKVFASLDMELILRNLEAILGRSLVGGCLLFLDEIQATPNAIAALRYFYEDRPDIPVIAAGSLLEFTLADHSFSMPVGRIEYMHLGPMGFREFLMAVDEYAYGEWLSLEEGKAVSDACHQRLLKRQREFLLTGGMPEAVETFRGSGSFEEVRRVQQMIGDTYQEDFSKYARQGYLADLQKIFRAIPAKIGQKLVYTDLLPGERSSRISTMLELLNKARIFSKVIHTSGNGLPLGAEANPKRSKPIFLDVGLVSSLLGLDWADIGMADERSLVNEGPLAEQYVGQHLLYDFGRGKELHYWTRESPKSNAELDYLVSRGSQIVPIEVKAGSAGSMKSLHQFMGERELPLAVRFDLNPVSRQEIRTSIPRGTKQVPVSYTLLSLPLYAVEALPAMLDRERGGLEPQ